MMRSPSLALRPVVSVSSTTWRVIVFWNSLVRQRVCAFVLRMPGVTAPPMPLSLMSGGELLELFPEVDVFHVLLVGRAPVAALPGMDPGGDPLLYIQGVGVDPHPTRPLQRLQRADDGHQLHAVVGGGRLPAAELLFLSLEAEDRTPAARPRIAAACAVRIDLHRFIPHGGFYDYAAKRAPAPGAARAPPATPGGRAAFRARDPRRGSRKCDLATPLTYC